MVRREDVLKALIFGIDGQDGFYLTRILKGLNVQVSGVSNISTEWTRGSVADLSFVKETIRSCRPDHIFHFAANSTTAHDALFENHGAISTGTLNILEGVRLHCPAAKVFLSGSAMQFKNNNRPINEKTSFDASSPYSVARIQSVYAGRYFRQAFGIKAYVGYFFNHDSALRTEQHVNQKIIAAVKRIEKGSAEKLELGNIDVKKEFNYAGDVVEAVWRLVNQDRIFEAVIGSGKAYSIKDWVDYCFSRINKDWKEYVVIKKGYMPEYKILVSDPRLIKSLGWRPRVGFHQLADKMLKGET